MYEPKIEVVREIWSHYGASAWGTSQDGPGERAYLVRGLPMPGERVVDPDGTVHTVAELEAKWVVTDKGCARLAERLATYDPEAERLRVATAAIMEYWRRTDDDEAEDIARAVLDAIKEVDDG